ncbi:flavin reductase, partial [Leclercia adecarboxylata]|nr:flavin reductase [Leclercia adecarboxylata]
MTKPPTAVPLEKAYRLLNHGAVTLITSAHAGVCNVMAASWVMPIDFFPLRLAAVIDLPTYT